MKKTLFIVTFCSIIILVPLVAVLAETVPSSGVTIDNPLQYDTITEVIDAVANFIAIVSSSIAVVMIIWAGIVYMTSGDNKDRTESAKKTIMWALIGIAIVWSAKFLIDLVEWVLGKK